ncbi:PLP-dependent transferase [Silvibacterium acidisoli]|uniref:PLP-dependent transferase n=1 Tax=Acidobacteriaceae bacterium ZG23-2 TaxID=2883246 RepID=UPI00406C29B7
MSIFRKARFTRRDVLKQSGMFTAVSAASSLSPALAKAQEPALPPLRVNPMKIDGDNLFTEIGVRPLINARGTYTIITGSRSLPQVKQAMFDASHYFVHLDELMPAVGREIAKLMGGEHAMVTTGCEAAIALATVACVAGTDPERTQSMPYRKVKDQVIIPKHSRNPYDFGVRMSGVEIIEVDSEEELRTRLTERVAMVYILSGPAAEKGPLSIPNICSIAKEKNVPVFVDAAAEEPLVPNIHIAHGATLVGYSGGKCMRGPQAAGVLLGNKNIIEAAWFNAAPHHNWGRALKVGKEEIMGMLAAVRQWYKRDHDAEQHEWRAWLKTIEDKVKGLPSVTTKYNEPEDLSNRSPELEISWDATKLGITGTELVEKLDKGTPRILVGSGSGKRPDQMQSSLTIMPYMMAADEAPIVADAVYEALTKPGHYENPVVPQGTPAQVGGSWAVTIKYLRGTGEQHFVLKQEGDQVTGTQKGEVYEAELKGVMHADHVELRSNMAVSGNEIPWTFKGVVSGGSISGTVQMGEYGAATWSAVKA